MLDFKFYDTSVEDKEQPQYKADPTIDQTPLKNPSLVVGYDLVSVKNLWSHFRSPCFYCTMRKKLCGYLPS